MIGITQIWERLFLGSLYDAERLGKANPLGITTVISLSETAPCNTRREITYIHVPIDDAQPIPVDQFDAIMRAIADHIRSGKVLIHCGSGVSRAPVITAAWMHLTGYKHFDAALEEIAELRPFINPSAIFVASVRGYLR
jgi:protein-tyrosine phosphatase